jgi:Ca-activated chloride channel family protein
MPAQIRQRLALVLVLATGLLSAQEAPVTQMDQVNRGELLIQTERPGEYQAAPLANTRVDIEVNGMIARARVTQTFSNPNDAWVEAIYAFPLPENAAVDHLRMSVGERLIEGVIGERQAARQAYDQAKQVGQHAALVEQHRPNLFTTSVANIAPKGEVIVSIEYQQTLLWRDGAFSLRFPMAVTPRYQPAVTRRIDERIQVDGGWSLLPGEIPNAAPLVTEPRDEELANNSMQLQLRLHAGFPVDGLHSAYHAIRTNALAADEIEIELADGRVLADRDFLLSWRPAADAAPRAAFFTEQSEGKTYGLLMVMPPSAQAAAIARRPRETLFVIDTSGSMGGNSIRQARAALLSGLDGLRPGDRLNIVEFNSDARALFDHSVPVSPRNLALAKGFVQALEAGGGTEMRSALRLALRADEPDAGLLRQIIFITDGAVGNEEELLQYIQQHLGAGRLFTVGIGAAPNSHFMTEAAHFGRGSYTYIAQAGEVRTVMEALFHKLEQPVLTDIRVELPEGADMTPDPIADLYAGEPISLAMKLDSPIQAVKITGRLGSTDWSQHLELKSSAQQQGMRVHWAREKIHQWLRQEITGVAHQTIRQAVLELALAHHLVSPYTSLLAMDVTPARPADEAMQSQAFKAVLPAGFEAVTSAGTLTLAQGATASRLDILLGALLLLLAWLIQRTGRNGAASC